MKKILCVLMIALMLMGTAFAEEEFTLHNGTKFGMTIDEVIESEKEQGNSFRKVSDKKITGDVTILGLAATIDFSFSSDDELTKQVYHFLPDTDFSFLEYNYKKVYGTPDCSSVTGESLVLPEPSFTELLPPKDAAIKCGGAEMDLPQISWSYSDMKFDQWLIEKDAGFIAIELYGKVLYGHVEGNSPVKVGWVSCVEYRLFDKEDVYSKREESARKLGDI